MEQKWRKKIKRQEEIIEGIIKNTGLTKIWPLDWIYTSLDSESYTSVHFLWTSQQQTWEKQTLSQKPCLTQKRTIQPNDILSHTHTHIHNRFKICPDDDIYLKIQPKITTGSTKTKQIQCKKPQKTACYLSNSAADTGEYTTDILWTQTYLRGH